MQVVDPLGANVVTTYVYNAASQLKSESTPLQNNKIVTYAYDQWANQKSRFTQIGNAVPPLFAYQLAGSVRAYLDARAALRGPRSCSEEAGRADNWRGSPSPPLGAASSVGPASPARAGPRCRPNSY